MEHRLLECGFTLDQIQGMDPQEVINRFAILSIMDERKSGEVDSEWSHLAMTK